ncbi:MAG: pilus assembly protein PilM [Planctomycetes bacterium]|nr:pilus assembly protein PilM [Planctomycetota bacterium]
MYARSKRATKIVAIDWDPRNLRLVHAFIGKRGVKVDCILSVEIPSSVDSSDPVQMGGVIRRALDQQGISTRHAVVDIPRDQVILNTLQLPLAAADELPGMVQIQVAKELPFPVGDAIVDFAVEGGQDGAGTVDVLVAAVRREVVAQYEATAVAAGLKLERIGLRPYAIKVSVCELLKHAMPPRVAFIDVRPFLTEIDVLRDGALSFSRAAEVRMPVHLDDTPVLSIAGGSSDSMDDDDVPATWDAVLDDLMVEVIRSLEAYRAGDPGTQIDHLVIGGDVGIEERLAEELQRRLSITTELYNPARTFGWEPDEGAAASAFGATLGLVLGHAEDGRLHFDFLHPKKTESVVKQRLRHAPAIAAVAALFLVALGVGVTKWSAPKRKELAEINQRIDELEDGKRENRKFLKVVNELRAFDTKQVIWVDALYEAMTALPSNEQMVLTQIEMNQKESRIVFKTKAKNRETAMEVIHLLEDYRRIDRELPRFKVAMGPQSEKGSKDYPYTQDLRVTILDDTAKRKASTKRKG